MHWSRRHITEWKPSYHYRWECLSSSLFNSTCYVLVMQGNHRVEAILFREQNLTAAKWWIADLVNSSIALSNSLAEMCAFANSEEKLLLSSS